MLGQLHLPNMMYHISAYLDQNPDLTWSRDNFLQDKMGNYYDKL